MKLNIRAKKVLKWIGYPLFFILCFMISLMMTFPWEQVQAKMVSHFKSEYDIDLSMNSLSFSFPFGLKAKDIIMESDKKEYASALPLVIPYMEVDFGLIATLTGTPTFDLDMEIYGGELEGSFAINQADQIYKIKMVAEGFQFAKMPNLKSSFPELPFKGEMGMNADLVLNMADVKKSTGFIEMSAKDGVVGPGKWNIELPMVRTGTLESRFVLKDGKLEVETFEQNSPDMESAMRGSIVLSKNLKYSRVNLDLRFKLADHMLEKYDLFKLALSAIRNAQAEDGYFYHTFRGALNSIKPIANKAAHYKFRDAGTTGGTDDDKRPSRTSRRPSTARKRTPPKTTPKQTTKSPRTKTASPRKTRSKPSSSAKPSSKKSDGVAPMAPGGSSRRNPREGLKARLLDQRRAAAEEDAAVEEEEEEVYEEEEEVEPEEAEPAEDDEQVKPEDDAAEESDTAAEEGEAEGTDDQTEVEEEE